MIKHILGFGGLYLHSFNITEFENILKISKYKKKYKKFENTSRTPPVEYFKTRRKAFIR
jgi:hypothetical protein